jgi:hypothetical protein
MTTNVNQGILDYVGDEEIASEYVPGYHPDGREIVMQLQPILQAQATHGPIFRRELFDAAYAVYMSLKNNNNSEEQNPSEAIHISAVPRELIRLPDIYGVERLDLATKDDVLAEFEGKQFVTKLLWSYNSLHHLGRTYDEDGSERLMPFTFTMLHESIDEQKCYTTSELYAQSSQRKAEWEDSEFCGRIKAFLEDHAGPTVTRVHKIICFGLGCFQREHFLDVRRHHMQHLAALTVRDIFARKQGGEAPLVYAQDPWYCPRGISYLQDHLDITVLEDPEGFKAMDGNTFVITVAPNVPVRQLAVDLTHEDGGPAGMLCNAVLTDEVELDGTSLCGTCNSSPAVWDFKQRSVWMEHDEDRNKDEWFGHMGLYLKKKKKAG